MDLSGSPTRFERTMTIPPVTHVIRVHTDTRRVNTPGDPGQLYYRVEPQRVNEIE